MPLANFSVLAASFIVQVLVLGALVWYTIETWKIRKASQDQAEALQKPCLTLLTEARNANDAILEMDDAVGGMIVAARNGDVTIQNMGSGPAINVRYRFDPVNAPRDVNAARPDGYLQIIPPGQRFQMPVSRGVLANMEYEFVATYESLSGRHYESRITLKNLVLVGSHFGPYAGN
jgi:hypothetical protein